MTTAMRSILRTFLADLFYFVALRLCQSPPFALLTKSIGQSLCLGLSSILDLALLSAIDGLIDLSVLITI